MNISIENFKNIKKLDFSLVKNRLSIIYASNGTGKSTISDALQSDGTDLEKFRSYYNWGDPIVIKDDSYNYVTYNEKFIGVKELDVDSPLGNSYELIFKDSHILSMEHMILDEKKDLLDFLDLEEYRNFKSNIDALSRALKITGSGSISNTAHVKAIKSRLPDSITRRSTNAKTVFDNQSDQVAYSEWKLRGREYEYLDFCPYCSQTMDEVIKNLRDDFDDNVDKNYVKNKNLIKEIFEEVSNKIVLRKTMILNIINGKNKLSSKTNEKIFKIAIRKILSAKNTIDQLEKIRQMQHNNEYKQVTIEKRIFSSSDPFALDFIQAIIDYNRKVRKLNSLRKGIMNKVERKITERNGDINAVLKSSGINYSLTFVKDIDLNVKAVLIHNENSTQVHDPSETLSFGEQNLVSVILFCILQKSSTGNVLIFDDPSTLFDSSKRHLFLHLLLSRNNFKLLNKNDYIVLLTHDFETFRDLAVMKLERKYTNKISCMLMENNNGECTIDETSNADFEYYIGNVINSIKSTTIPIVKLIYYRKLIYLGHINDSVNKIYNFISSVSKYKSPQTKSGSRVYSNVEIGEIISSIVDEGIIDGTELISYTDLVSSISVGNIITQLKGELMWYEKLVLFRVLGFFITDNSIEVTSVDPTIMKFITQCYHIEDDYIFDMDYTKRTSVPKYVFDLIDEVVLLIEVELRNRRLIV